MDSASDEGRLASERDYELCVKAANHIASIGKLSTLALGLVIV